MLQTSNYKISNVSPEEFKDYYQNQLKLKQMDSWPATISSKEQLNNFFEKTSGFWNPDFYRFIIKNSSDQMLGEINVFKACIYSDALEIGYALFDPKNFRQGIMKECLPVVIDYIFKSFRTKRLQLGIVPENIPSNSLAKSLGFTNEATLKEFFFLRGKDVDVNIWRLTRTEWEGQKV